MRIWFWVDVEGSLPEQNGGVFVSAVSLFTWLWSKVLRYLKGRICWFEVKKMRLGLVICLSLHENGGDVRTGSRGGLRCLGTSVFGRWEMVCGELRSVACVSRMWVMFVQRQTWVICWCEWKYTAEGVDFPVGCVVIWSRSCRDWVVGWRSCV